MGVVAAIETSKGTGVSGKYGETFVFTRRWLIRCDSPDTSKVLIARSVGVRFGDGHPDAVNHKAMEFDCTDSSGDGMIYELVVRYYVPPAGNTPDPDTGFPRDSWSASNTTTVLPAYKDKDGESITNSAGDPLEGIEKDADGFVITLTKYYYGDEEMYWSLDALLKSNCVNSEEWNASNPRTWKVEFKSATKKSLTDNAGETSAFYWETVWEFRFKWDTWDLKPWDIGFNQLVDSDGNPSANGSRRAAILGDDKKPVRQPVALNSDGTAKTPGEKPDALTFRVYREVPFLTTFGVPH